MKYELFASYEINPDFKSKSIMKATNCSFSHVGIIENDEMIFQATSKGFHSIRFDEFMPGNGLAHRFELKVLNIDFAAGWLRGNVGKDYSESQFLGFLFKIPWVRRLVSVRIRHKNESPALSKSCGGFSPAQAPPYLLQWSLLLCPRVKSRRPATACLRSSKPN
jgi:hypothetical protein